MSVLPDLSRYDRVAIDTETNGVTQRARPTGLGIATPDGKKVYLAWGHGDPEGLRGPASHNNITLPEVASWASRELTRPGQKRIAFNGPFDMRMLAYVGIFPTEVEDAWACQSLLNEHLTDGYSLEATATRHGVGHKDDTALHAWMVEHLTDGKGKSLLPTRKSCAPHYWKVPHEIIKDYGEGDPDVTLKLYDKLRPMITRENLDQVYRLETALMPVLLRMHLIGVKGDKQAATLLQERLRGERSNLLEAWHSKHGDVNPNSNKQLGPIFDALGIVYSMTKGRKNKLTGEIIEGSQLPSITKEFLDSIDHPIGDELRTMKRLKHYEGTFIKSYILDNLDDEDVIHGLFHALKGDRGGTNTGRLSSSDPLNLQNIPARDEYWAPLIRSLFIPMRSDQVWMRGDYSQIEYRFFAHYAGAYARRNGIASMMEQAYMLNPDIDFHAWVAEVTGMPRKPAKNINFCKLYGGGAKKIAMMIGCSLEEAQAFVDLYNGKIPESVELSRDLTAVAERRGYVITWQGRKCRFITEGDAAKKYKYPCTKNPNKYFKTYTALNKVLQGSAADLTKVAMVEVDKHIDWDADQMHLTVHDELDFSLLRETHVERANEIKNIMQEAALTKSWNGSVMQVPVRVEVELGNNWGMT